MRASALRRIARMPVGEIVGRSRQQTAKLLERASSRQLGNDAVAVLGEHAPAFADARAALAIVRRDVPARFFASANAARIEETFADYRRVILDRANAVLDGRFDLLGYRTLSFADPIDWHLDPVWDRKAPRVHWTRIDPLDASAVGDSKIVWELNRHQWMASLAEAYALTGHERYAQRALASIESWIDENPYGIGINWTSSLEAAYRIMSWSWMLMRLREADALSGERLQRILACVWLHASYVARYLSYFFSPNTHLTSEALGLFYAGVLFREFRKAAQWRDTAVRVLIDQSRLQICADGVHFERSTCYHRYTIETYQQFVLLARRNDVRVPLDVHDRLSRMLDFALAVRRPDGMLPEIGDADGGRLMPLVERHQCDPRGVFAVGAAMFGRSDLADAAAGPQADVALLMGVERASDSSPLRNRTSCPSRLFATGGYAVMQSEDSSAHQMIVDVGPLGCSYSCGHGHADLLSLQCSAFGEAVLVDPGTYCYTAEPRWRNFFRGTLAHSTLTIGGRNQVETAGPFAWHGRAAVKLHQWRSTATDDILDASHSAYGGITHRRRVLFAKPDCWVVVDTISENGVGCLFRADGPKKTPDPIYRKCQIELAFQFAPMHVAVVDERWIRAHTPGGNTFWIGSFAAVEPQVSVASGQLNPIRGWVSPNYGQRIPAPHAVFASTSRLPWSSITVLFPQRGVHRTPPAIRFPLSGGGSE